MALSQEHRCRSGTASRVDVVRVPAQGLELLRWREILSADLERTVSVPDLPLPERVQGTVWVEACTASAPSPAPAHGHEYGRGPSALAPSMMSVPILGGSPEQD